MPPLVPFPWIIQASTGIYLGIVAALVVALMGVVQARRRAERELAHSRELETRYKRLCDTTPAIIWHANPQGQPQWCNAQWERFSGRQAPFAWSTAVHPDDWPAVQAALAAMVAEQQELHTTLRMQRYDGTWRWLHVEATPRVLAQGELVGYSGMFADITVQKEAEDALRGIAEDKHNFLAIISHELRTPLNVVTGVTELLKEGIPVALPPEALEWVQRIDDAAHRQVALIQRILDFSDIQRGHVTLHRAEVSVLTLVQETLVVVTPLARKRGRTLRADATWAPVRMVTDAEKVKQILTQLLTNALTFTPHGAIELRVWEGAPGTVGFSVTDTGPGLTAAQQHHAFEPFWQSSNALNRAIGGLGLGLAMSRALAEALGGELKVESRIGFGTTFTLTLPTE